MPRTCVFCGAAGKLTCEHVFGEWLTRIGLSDGPVFMGAGRLNRTTRKIGVSKPFTTTVRDVCGQCNNGWMSKLESIASRVLPPLALGNAGAISEEDRGAIAAWMHKTVLVNMLITPEASRARGENLFAQEFRSLYSAWGKSSPVPQTRFWIGKYAGKARVAVAWMTPVTVNVDGQPVPEFPQAYVMTVIVGAVLLQGIRFTTPLLEFDLKTVQGFPQLWPAVGPIDWPAGAPVDDSVFLKVSMGSNLIPSNLPVHVIPWKPATELPSSEAEGALVRLPTLCGKHHVYYPSVLAFEGMRGVFHAFVTACECGTRYLIVTERDGAHCKADSTAMPSSEDSVLALYESLPGEELIVSGVAGDFVCKRLPPGWNPGANDSA